MFLKPEVSVVVSTYSRNNSFQDCPNLLKRAIDSILTQEFIDFELIIIDDGSMDGTKEVLEEYARLDPRVCVIRFEENSGCPAKRYNQGMAEAKGRYIAFMFDDDLWYPNALEVLHTSLSSSQPIVGMVYGQVKYLNVQEGTVMFEKFGEPWNLQALEENNILANNAVLIRREVIDKIGGYDEHPLIRRCCDYDLWRRLSKMYTATRVPIVIGEVFGFLPDSIGVTIPYVAAPIKKYLKKNRVFPLQKKQSPIPRISHFFYRAIEILKEKIYRISSSPAKISKQ